MTVRPGKNLFRAAVSLAVASVLTAFWPVLIFVLLLAVSVMAVAAAYDYRRLRELVGQVSVRRSLPQVVGRGRTFVVRLTFSNGGARPLAGEVRDVFPDAAQPRLVVHRISLARHDSAQSSIECSIPERGRHRFGPTWVRVYGPLRLVEGQRAVECPGEIKVLPETFASREQLQKDLGAELRLLDRMQRSRLHGAGSEFESLYPFRLGDDPRRIDWRATARQQELVVRRFQIERHRDVMILVDSGRQMGAEIGDGTKLDCAIDAALNLARVALHSGDRCGIGAYDRQVRGFLPPISGATALKSLVECMFDLQTQWHESEFTPMLAELRARRSKRTFLILISDVSDAETSKRLCASLQQLQRQHLVLFAALRTPLLHQIVNARLANAQDAAKKAVAFRLLRDRARALHALRRGGVHVLDVEPQQLTLPLVNQFVELRQRNLL
ncbi:MAG TPA: DUF58 domain-containing protein [Lacipirellula sp.]